MSQTGAPPPGGSDGGGGPGAGPPRDFVPVDDPGEAKKLLWEGARGQAASMLWTKNQTQVINSNLTVFSEREKLLWISNPQGFDPDAFVKHLADIGSADCFFNVSLAKASIFFKATCKGYDPGGLKFGLPDKIFKVQRRKDLRFPVPDGMVLKCEHGDPLFPENTMIRKVLDVSAGGLAIIVPPDDASVYQIDLVLKGVRFTIRSRRITVDAEVRHTRPLTNDPRNQGIKIGLLFRGIAQADADHISQFVMEESRKYFSKLF